MAVLFSWAWGVVLAGCSGHSPAGPGPEASVPDGAGPDAATQQDGSPDLEAAVPDGSVPIDAEPDGSVIQPVPPDQWGPYAVGATQFTVYDWSEVPPRTLETWVWYPADQPPPATPHTVYTLAVVISIEGMAYDDLPVSAQQAPHPLVMFSHGNKGIHFQSFSYTEYLASHGFVVAAPNHPNNTLFDFPDDEQMAEVALNRPADIALIYDEIVTRNGDSADLLYQKVDVATLGVSGHSFGGYTTLVLAGGRIDVSAAQLRCQQGTPSDLFCPYVIYWPAGTVVERPASMSIVQAALALAPGGYAAFGDDGLKYIDIPTMIQGGTLDDMTELDYEIRPIFENMDDTRYKVEIDGAGHMSFTDICRLPLTAYIPDLDEMCDPTVYIDIDRAFVIINAFATAFFRYHLKGEASMASYLTQQYAQTYPEVAFEAQ